MSLYRSLTGRKLNNKRPTGRQLIELVCCLGLFNNCYLAELAQLRWLCNVQFEDECVLEVRRMGKEKAVAYFVV